MYGGGTFVLPTFEGLNIAVLRLSFYIHHINISRLLTNEITTRIVVLYLLSFNTAKLRNYYHICK